MIYFWIMLGMSLFVGVVWRSARLAEHRDNFWWIPLGLVLALALAYPCLLMANPVWGIGPSTWDRVVVQKCHWEVRE